jgi:hypothetical protein
MNREENDKEKEKDDDFEWNKWCEKREMDEAVHENVITINYINEITVYKNIITYLINDSPSEIKNGASN